MHQFQHYVPRFLLKNFSPTNKNEVFEFNIQKNQWLKYPVAVSKICGEHGIYDIYQNIDSMEKIGTLEDKLSKLEDKACRAIRKTLKRKNLNEAERADLSFFIGILQVRTPKFLRMVDHFLQSSIKRTYDFMMQANIDGISEREKDIRDLKKQEKLDEAKIISELDSSKLEVKVLNNQILYYAFRAGLDVSKYYFHTNWKILRTSLESPFIISDNPVTLFNQRIIPTRLYRHGILASEEALCYLPISSTYCLECSWEKKDYVLTLLYEKEKDYKKVLEHLQSIKANLTSEDLKDFFQEDFNTFYARKQNTFINDQICDIDQTKVQRINKLMIENSDSKLYCSKKLDIDAQDYNFRKNGVKEFGPLTIIGDL